jgi:Flp pilus assembly pilin Flp
MMRRRSQSGQGMLEYILIVVLIAIAGLAVWKVFGNRIRALVLQSGQQLTSVVNGGPCQLPNGGGEGHWDCKDAAPGTAADAAKCDCVQ